MTIMHATSLLLTLVRFPQTSLQNHCSLMVTIESSLPSRIVHDTYPKPDPSNGGWNQPHSIYNFVRWQVWG